MRFELNIKKMFLNDIDDTRNLLMSRIYTKVADLDIVYARTKEPVRFCGRMSLVYKPIGVGETWGQLFDCAWFELSGKIPEPFKNEKLYLKFDISGEALLYDKEGNPQKGFTSGSSVFDRQYGEPGKRFYLVNNMIDDNGNIRLILDGACNDLFGNYQNNGQIICAEIVIQNDALLKLFYDMETIRFLMDIYEKGTEEYDQIFQDLHDVYKYVVFEENDYIQKSEEILAKYFTGKKAINHTVYSIGHAHLDLAWLWPVRETRRKFQRTLTNVFMLFEKYPDFKFGISQPQLLEWLETDSPYLYEKVKKYQKEGRLELQGGTWVEMDTNISGEEALVRQFLYGMNYYRDHFGFRPKILWLPDVFGYSGNLPQLIKKSGLDYFMTIKLSWCLINKFPYHSFRFTGIDGTEVLAHMPPEGNYNSSASAYAYNKTYNEYKEKAISDKSLLLFGIGDGGGGPGEEHVERIYRNQKIAALPQIKMTTSEEFFTELDKSRDIFPQYVGELYLENHQGTYTSQAKNKYYNRHLENKLRTVEYILCYFNRSEFREQMDVIWKEYLLYQFHDILPGSSIRRVYEESTQGYAKIEEKLDYILNLVLHGASSDLFDSPAIFNPNPTDTTLYLEKNGQSRKVQIEGLTSRLLADETSVIKEIALPKSFETDDLKIVFDYTSGNINSCIELSTGKELVGKDRANRLAVYKDTGNAWDISYYYRFQTPKCPALVKKQAFETNDYFTLCFEYTFMDSIIKENVRIHKHEKLIEFQHDTNWQNVGYMLRSGFDLNIQTNEAISDIQFGWISRSRAETSSIDKAKFEVPAQYWTSVSDGTCGAAIINDCKHGYYIKGSMLDINLHRSTNWPCVNGDIGRTTYKYGLYLHDGDLNKVDIKAQEINSVYIGLAKNVLDKKYFTLSSDLIHYSTLKQADGRNGNIIRLYNPTNNDVSGNISFNGRIVHLTETNLIEENQKFIGDDTDFRLDFHPFEIRTFCLE